MALTRRFLKELLADREDAAELIDQIIEAHAETVAELKAEMSAMTERVGMEPDELHKAVESAEAEVDRLKAAGYGGEWKARYEALSREFEEAKAERQMELERMKKSAAFRSLCLDAGISPRYVDAVTRGSRAMIDAMVMDGDQVKDAPALRNTLRREFADFMPSTPAGHPTRESIMSIADRTERLEAIKANRQLFAE